MRPIYAITGTGHHSRNGKDKIGKAIRTFMTEWKYAFREFSVPGDRNSMGGIIGIDPTSYDRNAGKPDGAVNANEGGAVGGHENTKVRILRKEDVEAQNNAVAAAAAAVADGDET
jgi:hypothetical protein